MEKFKIPVTQSNLIMNRLMKIIMMKQMKIDI